MIKTIRIASLSNVIVHHVSGLHVLAQHQDQDAAFNDDVSVVQLAALDFAKFDDDEYVEAYMGEMRSSPRASLKAAAWKALTPTEQAL